MSVGDVRDHLGARVGALSVVQRSALARALARLGGRSSRHELIAYLEGCSDDLDPRELRTFLAERLPEYMVPTRYVALGELPRTSIGKFDRRALLFASGRELESTQNGVVAPRTEAERTLARIWQDVLGIDEISVHDDFFEVGGDSLLSIRVISRAAREGLQMSPESFFEGPTIARLAEAAGAVATSAVQDVVVGSAPLTPIQHWFFDRISEGRDHWNQSVLLQAPRRLDPVELRPWIGALVEHHDALRARFVERDGTWTQHFTEVSEAPPFRVVDLEGGPAADRERLIESEADVVHASLDLSEGMLFRALLFDDGADFQRLLLVAHHLIVDAVSWGILLDDLSTLSTQAPGSSSPVLPPKTISALDWSAALAEAAIRPTTKDLSRLWLGQDTEFGAVAPSAAAGGTGAATHAVKLGVLATEALTNSALARDRGTLHELLLAGVLLGWCRWARAAGLQVDVEGHGRDALERELDVSRTVGWFTTVFPISLRPAEISAAACVDTVRAAYRRLPMNGASHGLLRYLAGSDTRGALAEQPRSRVLFNYLGAGRSALPPDSQFEWAPEPSGLARSPDAGQAYPLEINVRIENGSLMLYLTFDQAVYAAADVGAVGEAVRAALAEIAGSVVGGAAAFDLSGLDEAGLEQVSRLLSEVEEL